MRTSPRWFTVSRQTYVRNPVWVALRVRSCPWKILALVQLCVLHTVYYQHMPIQHLHGENVVKNYTLDTLVSVSGSQFDPSSNTYTIDFPQSGKVMEWPQRRGSGQVCAGNRTGTHNAAYYRNWKRLKISGYISHRKEQGTLTWWYTSSPNRNDFKTTMTSF